MVRNNINHDVSELLAKYDISEILNEIVEMSSDTVVHSMRMWFKRELTENGIAGGNAEIGDELDEDVVEAIFHELGHVNMRLTRLERGGAVAADAESKDEMVITPEKMKKIIEFLKEKEKEDDKE
ncbi:MAG TPA: hypothetical protein PLW50_00670 [Smithellaceae bacterium]|nr:hypothetical protein [Smithellaceae bacterium]